MWEDFGLEQLLADPLIRLVMSSDAVEEADIRKLAKHARLSRQTQPSHAGRSGCAPQPEPLHG